MKTVGEFLAECAARLAPFERTRVAKVGCWTAVAVVAAAALALAAGIVPAHGTMASLRLLILSGLATVVILFAIYAVLETLVERSLRARIQIYMGESLTDLETLLLAAEARKEHIAGGHRLLALLKETTTRN